MYFSSFFFSQNRTASTCPVETGPELFREEETKPHECTWAPCVLETNEESMEHPTWSPKKQSTVMGHEELSRVLNHRAFWKLPVTSTSCLMYASLSLPWHLLFCLEAVCPQPNINSFIFQVCASFSRFFVEEAHLRLSTGENKLNNSVWVCCLSFGDRIFCWIWRSLFWLDWLASKLPRPLLPVSWAPRLQMYGVSPAFYIGSSSLPSKYFTHWAIFTDPWMALSCNIRKEESLVLMVLAQGPSLRLGVAGTVVQKNKSKKWTEHWEL